jgi:hypothetical protein
MRPTLINRIIEDILYHILGKSLRQKLDFIQLIHPVVHLFPCELSTAFIARVRGQTALLRNDSWLDPGFPLAPAPTIYHVNHDCPSPILQQPPYGNSTALHGLQTAILMPD